MQKSESHIWNRSDRAANIKNLRTSKIHAAEKWAKVK